MSCDPEVPNIELLLTLGAYANAAAVTNPLVWLLVFPKRRKVITRQIKDLGVLLDVVPGHQSHFRRRSHKAAEVRNKYQNSILMRTRCSPAFAAGG